MDRDTPAPTDPSAHCPTTMDLRWINPDVGRGHLAGEVEVEGNADGYFLLHLEWYDIPVNESRVVEVRSATRHAEEGRRSPKGSLGTEQSEVEWLGYCPESE